MYRLLCAGIAVAVVTTGCGSPAGTVRSDTKASPTAAAAIVNCGGSVYDPSELADAVPASSLPDGPAGAIDDAGAPAFDPSQDWKVVHLSDDRVDLVSELEEPVDIGGGDVRTHESRTLRSTCSSTSGRVRPARPPRGASSCSS